MVALLRLLKGTRVIVDWHNLAYSIMALTQGNSGFVKLAKLIEVIFSRSSDVSFCVTNALGNMLREEWGVSNVVVLYDKPPSFFRTSSMDTLYQMLRKYAPELESVFKQDARPTLAVSATSYTPDEDFSILLEALQQFDSNRASNTLELVVIVTGKGPLKEYYQKKILNSNMVHVQVLQLWLESEDYPLLIGAADFGISLHTSSSGLDLPMKIVDMFGCGIPVCAIDFPWYKLL